MFKSFANAKNQKPEVLESEYVTLAEVPSKYFEKQMSSKKSLKWSVNYNVAAWVRIQNRAKAQIELVITYQDVEGLKEATIEKNSGIDASLLLSGMANLNPVGQISHMSVEIKGAPESAKVFVDELFVQKAATENDASQSPRFVMKA